MPRCSNWFGFAPWLKPNSLRFPGCPTVLVDGVDLFAEHLVGVAQCCRLYPSGSGSSGAPTAAQLTAAQLTDALRLQSDRSRRSP